MAFFSESIHPIYSPHRQQQLDMGMKTTKKPKIFDLFKLKNMKDAISLW
mgnify:CR=1 FL=1